MKKTPSEMTPEEYWKHIHGKRNLNGLIRLNTKEADEALPHARHLAFCVELKTQGTDILRLMEEIKGLCSAPALQPSSFQCLEYHLSQYVIECAEAMKHAGKLQAYLHGARQSNETICKLREEAAEGFKP